MITFRSENKAKSLNIFSFNFPHHASFHMSWMGFFVSFVSTFAAAPMIAIIREDLELTKPNLGSAGLAAVTGTIGARVLMGSVCDVVGPRYGLSIVLLLSAPFCFCMSYVTSPAVLAFSLGRSLGRSAEATSPRHPIDADWRGNDTRLPAEGPPV